MSGLIAFARDSDVYTILPDGSELDLISHDPTAHLRPLAWLTDGSRLAILAEPLDNPYSAELRLIDPDGSNPAVLGTLQPVYSPASWSSDGERIAFGSDGSPPHGISILDLVTGELRQLTSDGGAGRDALVGPVWSPDGTRIAYLVNPGGDVWIVDVETAARSNLSRDGASLGPTSWVTVDGREYVVYQSYRDVDQNRDSHRTWVADPDTGTTQLLAETNLAVDPGPVPRRYSPDGMSYVHIEDPGTFIVRGVEGNTRVWPEGAVLVERSGYGSWDLDTFSPSWSPDGSHLAFVAPADEGDGPARDIFIVRFAARGEPQLINLTRSPEDESASVWQPLPAR